MTKISQLIEAGRSIEESKNGFTVSELMSKLKWEAKEKQYVQSIMFLLSKRGQVHKLNNTRPVVYTLKPLAGAKILKAQAAKSAVDKANEEKRRKTAATPAHTATQLQEPSASGPPMLSLDDLSNMEISLEMIGEGVFRRNRELERRVHELESELVVTKRRLDDANKRVAEQTRMIEKQNQIISDQNRERRPRIPTAKLKEAASVDWKRRS